MEILTPQEVRRVLKCSLPYVYKLAEQGRLACICIPCPGSGQRQKSMVRFKLEDVQAFIEQNYRPMTT